MRMFRSLLIFGLPLSLLAACGTDGDPESPLDSGLDLAAVANDCPAGEISDDIAAIFPTSESLRHVATVNCGQIFRDFGKGKQAEAIHKFFRFFGRTLQQYENDQLQDPDPSVEVKIADLFGEICALIGCPLADIDPEVIASGEYAVGTLSPGGPPVLTVSRHSGIGDPDEALSGPVDVVIFQIFAEDGNVESELELASENHPCPADVDNSFDCYPLFFDYSIFPESNLKPDMSLQLGQCNVSPEEVQVLLLSPEGFLPEDDAPTGVLCDDVGPGEEIAMTGWRKYAWAVLEPLSPLFSVTPAIAGKSPIGGRISAFSPVAPADPESGEPAPNATETSLTPEDDTAFSGELASFTATVTEAIGGDPVTSGMVRFTVSDGESTQEFQGAVEGSASMNVGCNTDGAGDIDVPFGNYIITAEYLENTTHASSSDPEPSTLTCSEIVIG